MKKYNLGVMAVALAGALTSVGALGATGVGAINHDIRFGGIIAENAPKWVWSLPQNTVRIDLRDGDGVVDTASSTKVWDIMQNRQPYRFLEGYMEPTVNGSVMLGLNPDVKYLQDGAEVTPTYDTTNATLLPLKATGNKDTTPVDGHLELTLQPVLLLAQAENAGDTTLIGKPLAGVGVTQADVNATQAYNNAITKLASQQSKVGATRITYDMNTPWPANTLNDGTEVKLPMIGGYASTMTAGKLSFPQDTPVSQWESVITVQVQYK
ncbi:MULTISPECIES: hypothetical protein [Providencia]|uniref:Fimbrial, major and minor subunit n=2 Tax=Providencia stuartii TaxID=588 RepID=A0AA86YW47_PROST|nr:MULTISPECIES: hypothetical protein [Providencia]EDU57492.1 Fimbrial, major and minor subunit [Providencia stuartii ATCC 25827]QPN41292.1 hypothetical protein I3B46_03820 [Providencia sp. 2.29]MTC81018.1 hypothetical protein [Providencia stuartii]QIB28958.1 hypothetical protein G3A48_03820 [Providencia stuartii]RMA08590.1 hypothetical protein EA147_16535 [Providencia stuartii]